VGAGSLWPIITFFVETTFENRPVLGGSKLALSTWNICNLWKMHHQGKGPMQLCNPGLNNVASKKQTRFESVGAFENVLKAFNPSYLPTYTHLPPFPQPLTYLLLRPAYLFLVTY
jgi:hypothetical protein